MVKRSNSVILITALAVAATGSLPAHGQEAKLEEIVVSARKRDENLQEIPVAVTAFGEKELGRLGIASMGDIAAYTPGLSFEDYGGALEAPVIRGQNQIRLNNPVQNVSTFLDGVYLQRSYMIDVGVVSLDRIEVIKGPQSATYGQNSFGGAINYVTKKPTADFEADVSVSLGSDKLFGGKATFSGPIIGDKLLGLVTFGKESFDGTWKNGHPLADDNISPGSDGNLGGHDNQTFAGALRFLPADSLTVDLAYYRNEISEESRASFTRMGRDGIAFFGFDRVNTLNCSATTQPMLGFLGANNALWCGELTTELPASSGSGDTIVRDPRSFGQEGVNEIMSAKAAWEISDAVTTTYLFGRAKSRIRSGGQSIPNALLGSGNPMSLLNFMPGKVIFDSQPNGGLTSDSHELRVVYDNKGIFNASVGFFSYKSDDTYEAIAYQLDPLGSIPLTSLPNTDPNPDLFVDKTEAVFAQIGLDLLDKRLKFNLEGRYAESDKSVETIGIANTAAAATFYAFTPRLTIDYTLTPGHLLYGSFAQGIKAGGFNSPILANSGRPVDPSQATYKDESNWTYEIGSKNTFLDGRLLANLAVYFIDWTDLQISATAVNGGPQDPVQIDNIGGATTYGAEFESIWNATDAVRLNLGLSYSNPTFDKGIIYIEAASDNWCDGVVCPVDGDIGGNTLNRVPKLQGNLGAQYSGNTTAGNTYYVRGDVTYQSKQYMELLNVGWVPERTLFNARAGYTGGEGTWEVSLWAKNLLDKKYVSNSLFLGFSNGYVASLGDRRTYGMTASFNFK